MQRKLSEKEVLDMRESHKEGDTITDLAERYDTSFTTVHGYVHSKSPSLYWHKQARKRQQLPEYQAMSGLIQTRLKELGETYTWLAKQMDVSRNMVSLYAQGKSIPSEDKLKIMFSALKVEYETIDDVVEANKRLNSLVSDA